MEFRRVLPWAVAALFAPLYAAVSLTRHARLESAGFDLGIFEEAVRGYARLGAPVVALKGEGYNLLGDHFSPVLAVLAPVYRLWPGAGTLLVAQAVLLALSAVPVTAFAVRTLGRVRYGAAAGVAYGLSAGLQSAAAFDFHEVAFAVPPAAAAVVALARGRYGAAVGWALPLLLVKEDQALLVAAVGGYVWWRGRRGLGVVTVLVAVAAGLLVTLVVIPAFNPGGEYSYAHMGTSDGASPPALLLPGVKARTVLVLLAPTLLLALRSPLVLLPGVLLAARFWADNPAFWRTGQHYDAVLAPLLFVAGLHGLGRLRPRAGRAAARAAVAGMLVVTVLMTATGPVAGLLTDLSSGDAQRADGRAAQVRRVLAAVPDGARVAAANRLAPQLTARYTVSLFPYLTPPGTDGGWQRPAADWVAVLDEPDAFPVPPREQLRTLAELSASGYRPVAAGAGVTVYHLRADGR
ncbi:DUF2079 domain-containing protein [Kitasatospora sp. NPDC056783]|uniref:DUF2079 domain-containing protein n=1 Tax=Kitasatospora sp. NPDC056783 TaxID=3345943 RepID=UPI0036CB57BA